MKSSTLLLKLPNCIAASSAVPCLRRLFVRSPNSVLTGSPNFLRSWWRGLATMTARRRRRSFQTSKRVFSHERCGNQPVARKRGIIRERLLSEWASRLSRRIAAVSLRCSYGSVMVAMDVRTHFFIVRLKSTLHRLTRARVARRRRPRVCRCKSIL